MKSKITHIKDYFSPKPPTNIPALKIAQEVLKRINKTLSHPCIVNVYFDNRKFEISARNIYPTYHTLEIREYIGRIVYGIWLDEIDGQKNIGKILIRAQYEVPQVLDIGKYKDNYNIVLAHTLQDRSIYLIESEGNTEVALKNGRKIVHIEPSRLLNEETIFPNYYGHGIDR